MQRDRNVIQFVFVRTYGGRDGVQSGRSCNTEASSDRQQSPSQNVSPERKNKQERENYRADGDIYNSSQVKRLARRWTDRIVAETERESM